MKDQDLVLCAYLEIIFSPQIAVTPIFGLRTKVSVEASTIIFSLDTCSGRLKVQVSEFADHNSTLTTELWQACIHGIEHGSRL